MSTMDKSDVNNFIVKMRSCIKQARVHICNKLVQEKEKLLNKKCSEEKRKKFSRKAERLVKEILILKKLKDDELTKYVLLCAENPLERFHKCALEPDERVKMRFAIHKSVSKHVEEFRTKFPDWALKLPPLIVQLGMRYKMQKKIRTNKKNKNKEKDEDNEKSEHVEGNKQSKKEDRTLSEKKLISNDNVAVQTKLNEKPGKARLVEVRRFADLLELEERKSQIENSDHQLENEKNNSALKNVTLETKKSKLVAKVEILKDNADLEKDNIIDDADDFDQLSSTDKTSSHVTSDPFFLQGSESEGSENEDRIVMERKHENPTGVTFKNEHLKTMCENKFLTNGDKNSKKIQQNGETMPSLNRKQRRLLKKQIAEKGMSDLKSDDISKILTYSKSTKNKSLSLKKKPLQRIGKEVDSLHPSWEAKRKEREIVPFQGKKIKFDDD